MANDEYDVSITLRICDIFYERPVADVNLGI